MSSDKFCIFVVKIHPSLTCLNILKTDDEKNCNFKINKYLLTNLETSLLKKKLVADLRHFQQTASDVYIKLGRVSCVAAEEMFMISDMSRLHQRMPLRTCAQ